MHNSVLDVEVSCFDNIKATTPKRVNLLEWITTSKFLKEIEVIRNTTDEDLIRNIKSTLEAITPSAVLEYRRMDGLLRHTGLIQLDVDFKDNIHIENYTSIKSELAKMENVAYCGLSVSGRGYWVIIPICYPYKHTQYFDFLEKKFKEFGINIDSSGKDITRLRIFSIDPDAYFNNQAIPLVNYGHEEIVTATDSKEFEHDLNKDRAVVEAFIQMIIKNEIDITVGYSKWFHLGCALANTFQESGRQYYHHISQFNSKYNRRRCDDQYSKCLAKEGPITLGTFFHFCKEAGIIRDYDVVRYENDEIEIEYLD